MPALKSLVFIFLTIVLVFILDHGCGNAMDLHRQSMMNHRGGKCAHRPGHFWDDGLGRCHDCKDCISHPSGPQHCSRDQLQQCKGYLEVKRMCNLPDAYYDRGTDRCQMCQKSLCHTEIKCIDASMCKFDIKNESTSDVDKEETGSVSKTGKHTKIIVPVILVSVVFIVLIVVGTVALCRRNRRNRTRRAAGMYDSRLHFAIPDFGWRRSRSELHIGTDGGHTYTPPAD